MPYSASSSSSEEDNLRDEFAEKRQSQYFYHLAKNRPRRPFVFSVHKEAPGEAYDIPPHDDPPVRPPARADTWDAASCSLVFWGAWRQELRTGLRREIHNHRYAAVGDFRVAGLLQFAFEKNHRYTAEYGTKIWPVGNPHV